MEQMNVSRRAVLLAGAGAALGSASATPTVGDVIDRIKESVGVPWREETVGRIVAGSAAIPVKGIAVTMMATLDVIQRAAAAGKNFVMTHEPTFYLHQDTVQGLEQDPTYLFKAEFIRKHEMAVFRFHDHWHAHQPDGISYGMARELGWAKYADRDGLTMFTFPAAARLSELAREMAAKLQVRAMRVVGDPKLSVRRVAASWGAGGRDAVIKLFRVPDVDAVVIGEGREWEIVEYAQDAISAGQKKALIILGHVVSEQAGMKYCAEWLKGFISNVPVEFVGAEEPFWRP
jgi:putative NIF3 family GTP cyclohydrolase 1 type 2